MKFIICSVIFLAIGNIAFAQKDSSFVLHGKIVNLKDEPLPFAHIKVKKSLKGTISNLQGEYRLRVHPLDAVVVSCVGYKTAMFYVPSNIDEDFSNRTVLNNDTILLEEAIVAPWPGTYNKLKEEIKKVPIADSQVFKETERFVLNQDEINEYKSLGSDGAPAMTFPGPISLLHSAFGDKPKQYRKLEKDKLKSQNERIVAKRFNEEIVKELTSIEKDSEIQEFMEFCKFSTEFLVNASAYNIAIAIRNKFKEYLEIKSNDYH